MTALLLGAIPARVAAGPLSGKSHYLHWGVIQLSLVNFVIILVMVALFVAALLVPFPGSKSTEIEEESSDVAH